MTDAFVPFEAEIRLDTGSYIFEPGKKVEVKAYDPADDTYRIHIKDSAIWVKKSQLKSIINIQK